MTSLATCNIADGIATLTLDDGKANALSFDMLAAFENALDEAEKADVIVLTGREKVTCAGFDLKVMQNDPDRAPEMVTRGGKLLVRLFGCPKPVVIASAGHGIAAGALLMLTADIRIGAAGEARYGLNESAIGMVLPRYGIDLAKFKIAPHRLDHVVSAAKLYAPEEAAEVGFLDQVVAADALMETALATAKTLQELDGKAFAGNKKRIRGDWVTKMTKDLEGGARV